MTAAGVRDRLRADCASCSGLCCVVPAFAVSADFAIDKPAGQPCPNLQPDLRCGIHSRLRPDGFAGCAAYDCFGAGQHVSQVTFAGQDWRADPGTAQEMFAVFPVMRALHELLWHLAEALSLAAAHPLHTELRHAFDETEQLTQANAGSLRDLDVDAHRQAVATLLRQASELVRAEVTDDSKDLAGVDLIGADLSHAALRGASLRGARLIAADLRGADLRAADLTGADLRGADLGGADLTDAIFLTQAQLDAAKGDQQTRLPATLRRPPHW